MTRLARFAAFTLVTALAGSGCAFALDYPTRSVKWIVPYPPGIPVLVPGQLITSKIVDYIADLLHSHKRMEMHGVVHEGYLPCIRVLRPEEEKALHRLR